MAILGILLTILKIIGIILLVLLGILILIVAVILLVPIRYQGEGQKEETLSGHLKVTWLLHLLSASASLSSDGMQLSIRIAGKTIYPKEKKPSKQKASKQKSKETSKQNPPKQTLPKDDAKKVDANDSNINKKENLKTEQTGLPEEVKEVYEPKQPLLESHEESVEKIQSEQLESKAKPQTKQRQENKEFQSQSTQKEHSSEKKQTSHPKKDPISLLKEKLAAAKQSLLQKLLSLKKKFLGIKTNLQETKKKLDYWKNLLLSDPMKEAFSKLVKTAKALLRHILPRRLSGRIHFGFEDPSLTGKILAYLSMIYPFTKDTLVIEPEFEAQELILEGNLSFRGRIRLGYLLYLVLSVVLDKNIRRQYKRLRQGGKEDGEGTK